MISLENVFNVSLQDDLKMSWRRLQNALKTSWRCLEDAFARRLEDVLKTSWRLLKTFWRRLKDVLKMSWRQFCRRLENVLKTSWRPLEDVLKTSWRHMTKTNILVLTKTPWRRFQNVLKTSSEDEDERGLQDALIRTNQDEYLMGYTQKHQNDINWGNNVDFNANNKHIFPLRYLWKLPSRITSENLEDFQRKYLWSKSVIVKPLLWHSQ